MLLDKSKRYGKTFRHDRSKWDPRDKLRADQKDFWLARDDALPNDRSTLFGLRTMARSKESPFSGTRRNRRAGKLKQQRIRERSDEDIIREIFEGLDG